ncbi:MAG TPA: hypothetical protein VJJ77_04790, partial [Dongiaceae bacterium]|nr:hypothetical protein [Dongiaceae bacterium]
ESALAEEADKARAAEHVGQLRTARAGLEQQIAVLDGALADMDYRTPPAVALTATRDSLDAAYRSIDTALQEQAPRAPLATLLMNSAPIQPTEAPAPAPQVAAVQPMEAPAPTIDIGKARPELQRSYAELDEYVQGLDAQLEQVDPNSAEAGRIRGQRDAYTLQRQDVLATIAAETNQAPRRATPPPAPAAPPRETREATLEGVLQGIETAVAGLDGQLEALPQSAPQRPALLAWRQGLLSGFDNIVEEIQRRRQEDTKPRAQLVMQRQEVPPLDSYMNWVEQGVLPAFGESPLARQVLPGILAGLAFRFGAETADQIVDGALDELEAEGLGPDAAALLDKLFGAVAAATRAEEGAEAGRLADLAHVRFLAEAIRQPELGRAPGSAAKPTPADEAATASLQASLDGLVNRLFEEVGSALRRDVRDLPKTLDHLSGLLELAALPLKERPQLEPLFNEIRRNLDRALAAPPDEAVAVENSARQQITALRRALVALPAGQSPEKAGALAERLAGLLADSYKLLGRALERRAETADDPEQAASLRRQGAAIGFAEARARLQTGQIVEAWKMLNEARGGDADVENARAAAIIDAVALLEGGYGLLSIDDQRALGTLETLRGARDAALRRLAETASDPAIAAAAAQRLAQQLEGAGRADEAARVIGQALSRSPDDPVLNGERLRLQLAAAGENAAREAANLLGQVPEQARLEAALLALGGLGAKGQGPALEALAAALAGADWVAPENRPAVELQVQLARVDLLSGQTPGAERDAALGQAAARAKALLDGLPASTTEAQARYREAVATSLAELQQQLDGVEGWREAIASGNPPEGGFAVVARQAMAAGHIEIAAEALVKLMQAQDGAARGDLVAAVRATTLLLERMRARLEDPNLNEQQRASGQRFLERVSSAALETIGQRLEGWPQSHGTLWQMTYAARQKQSSETADRMERTVDDTQRDFRILVRLQTQIRLAAASPNERGGILNGAVNDLNRQITEQERRIRDEFNPLGKAVESGQTRERLQAALGRLNALRVLRDGVRDYQLDTTGRTEQFVGIDSVFRTAREWALRDVEMGLNGFSRGTATNDSAARTGNARARYIYYTDTIRFFEMLQEKDPKQWTEGLLAADEMAYLERRRVEVIFEDRELTPQQQETRLREHLGHEAATFERWGKDVHPFLLPELSGIGQGDLDRARQIYTRIDANRQSFLEAELDRAKQSGDAQAGFRALVELRERSLKGEIDAFVNYLNLEWYRAGPARAYNLWIGMEGTQEALEWTTAEAGRLHGALIRASYNLPGALSEDDKILLRRHGYIEGDGAGRYTIPDYARLVPTTAGSEFTALTQQGPLATVDNLLNAQRLAELTATVVLPGGVAGKFGK